MKKNNKGFSLVELIVTFAIVAIIGVAVYGFMAVSNRQFVSTSNDVGLQYDQQIVVNQIRDYILESSNSIFYDDVAQSLYVFKQSNDKLPGVAPDPLVPGDLGTPDTEYAYQISKLRFNDPNGGLLPGEEGFDPTKTGELYVKSFLVEKGDAESYYSTTHDDDDTNDESIDDLYKDGLEISDERLLGSNIQSLTYDFGDIANDKVAFDIIFYSEGKEFKSHQVVSLRNNVKFDDSDFVANTTATQVTSSIEGVKVYRAGYDEELNAAAGDIPAKHIGKYGADDVNVQLTADVIANVASKYDYNFGVSWKLYDLAGNELTYDSNGIGIGADDGLIKVKGTVAENTEVRVIATSKDDPNKSAIVDFKIDDIGAYPFSAKLTATYTDMNGYRLYTFVPSVVYTSALDETGTNILTGDALLTGSSKIEWEREGEFPETVNGVKSELNEKTGMLSITELAEGKQLRFRFKVKELKADGTPVYSNWWDVDTTNIPEYVAPETLKLSMPDLINRGDTSVATVSWLTTPSEKIKYYWKIVDDVDNTTSAWYDVTVGAIATNFDKVVNVLENDNTSSYFLKAGTIGNTYGDFTEGVDGSNWYESYNDRFARMYVQSYLYWKRAYKIKVMCFAVGYADDGVSAKVVYDASGRHEISEGKPIVPVVATTTVPKVQFIIEPTSTYKGVEGYKTSKIIQQNAKAPGEQRAFNYRLVGLSTFNDVDGNSSLTSDSKSLNTHYIFYNSAGNKVNVNRNRGNMGYVLAGESRVDKEELYDTAEQFMFELDIAKNRNNKNTDFFTYNPQKMTFNMTLNQNINIDGTIVVNGVDSNEIKYNLMYKNNQ